MLRAIFKKANTPIQGSASLTQLCDRMPPLVPGCHGRDILDPVTGRGTGFLPITVTPDVGIGNPFLGGGGPRDIQLAVKFIF